MSHNEDPTIAAPITEAEAPTPAARPKIVLKPKATAAAVIHKAQATDETPDAAAEPDAEALEKLATARRDRAARLKGVHNPAALPEPPIVPEPHNAHVAPPEEVVEMAYAPPTDTVADREGPLNFNPDYKVPTTANIRNASAAKTGKTEEVPFGTVSIARVKKNGPGSNIMAMYPARQFAADCAAHISSKLKSAFEDPAQQKRLEYFVKEALGSKQIQIQYDKNFFRFPAIFPDMLADAVQSQILANIHDNNAALESHRFLLKEAGRDQYILAPLIADGVRDFARECVETMALPEPEGPSQHGGRRRY